MSQDDFRAKHCSECEGNSLNGYASINQTDHSDKNSYTTQKDAVAIIGVAFRFPNDICNESTFWSALRNGEDLVSQIPADRWSVKELQHPKRSESGRSITFSAGVLSRIDEFDATFFGISSREAMSLDPQQRLLLELSWEAMENASVLPSSLAGSDCAVYVGIAGVDYGTRSLDDLASINAHSMTGNTLSIAANRLSYIFDLHGPSVSVDTACSSSLIALHQACSCLQAGDASTALVGGVNLLLHPYSFIGFTKAFMLSANGRCKSFDASGDGYVRSEGGAVLLLKPLAKALEDNDDIQAVILGTGANSDGARKTGITMPSAEGQAELMQRVLEKSGLSGDDIDFVEAHGTGTVIGDPIEAASIAKVYSTGRPMGKPLPIGSVKTNLGHMEAASGMAGLVKALMVLKHRGVPPNIHLSELNPNIDFAKLNIEVVQQYTELAKSPKTPLVVAVNSFGFGGTNAHVLVQEFLNPLAPADKPIITSLPPLFLSARSSEALIEMAERYADFLDTKSIEDFYDIAYSAAYRREPLEKRLTLLAESKEQVITLLRQFAKGDTPSQMVLEDAIWEDSKIAFVYSGNGAQWIGMGQQLITESPRFLELLSMLDKAMLPLAGFSILQEIQADETLSRLDDTTVAQPLLFAIQVAITSWLREQGIVPYAVTGHSVGEVAAAWASGALTLSQAISVICARSSAQGETRGSGRMAAVALSELSMRDVLSALDLVQRVTIAGVNSPNNITLSGDLAALELIQAELKPKGIFFVLLDLDYAFHSRQMDSIQNTLLHSLETLLPSASDDALFMSTVTGGVCEGEQLDADYWWRNIRQPVRFADSLKSLIDAGCRIFVEISPHAILQRYITECLKAAKVTGRALFVLRKQEESIERLQSTACKVRMLCKTPKWDTYFPQPGRYIRLPNYPWQRESHWHTVTNESRRVLTSLRVHPLLGWRLTECEWGWENTLDTLMYPWLIDHQVANSVVLPGAAYAEMVLAAANEWRPGERLAFEELMILSPIVFDEQHARTIRLTINPQDGSFRIRSRQRLSDDEWVLHAVGRIVSALTQAVTPLIPEIPKADYVIDHDTHYRLCSSLGLDYGPAFRGLTEAAVYKDYLEGYLLIPENIASFSDYILHPAILDICFQSLVDFFKEDIEGGRDTALLPVKIDHLVIYQRAVPAFFRAQLCKKSERSTLVNFELFDHAGALIARLSSCRFRTATLQYRQQHQVHGWEIVPCLKSHPADLLTTTIMSTASIADEIRQWFISHEPQLHRKQWFQEAQPLFEALSLAFMYESFELLLDKHSDYMQEMLNNVSAFPLLRFIKQCLIQENLLAEKNTHWQLVDSMPGSEEIWQTILHDHPESLTELALIGRVGRHLADLLIGSLEWQVFTDSLRHSPTTESLFDDDPAYQGSLLALKHSLEIAVGSWSEYRPLRILEISPKISSLASFVHQMLPEDHLHYVLALSDEEAQSRYQSEFHDFSNVTITYADLSGHQLESEDSLPQQFDVVILHHVLHTTLIPKMVLAWVKSLMTPGALLLLAERQADWSATLLEGLDINGWYQLDEAERIVSRLLSPSAWKALLEEECFSDIESVIEPEAQDIESGAYVVLAKRAAADALAISEIKAERWLLLTDAVSDVMANPLAQLLVSQAQEVICADDPSIVTISEFDHIVFMRDWTKTPENGLDSATLLLQWVQMLAEDQIEQVRLWVITHGGHLSNAFIGNVTPNPIQASLWGFGRVVMNELPELCLTLIDIACPLTASGLTERLRNELLIPDGCNEIILTQQARYQLVMQEVSLQKTEALPEQYHLDFYVPGQLRNLVWLPQDTPSLGAHEIEVCPKAVGLNFRDVMYVMGLLPDESVEKGFAGASLGLEFAGVVNRVGESVVSYAPGDMVMGFGSACFSSHLVTRDDAVAMMPADWSFEAAATIPTVFFTVYYALTHLANLQPGEKILIHGGAGGVGIAAIQLAKYLGAEIYVTAGSEEKRDFVHLLGADHVFDSRSLAFADEIFTATAGEGVDVILNSLAGEAIRSNLRILRPFGRFLELGKRDFVENTPIGLRYFKDNISYFGIDADQLLTGNPRLAARLFSEVMTLLREGILSPLPWRSFMSNRVIDAFRVMQQARHIGKIVVTSSSKSLPLIESKMVLAPRLNLEKQSTWMIAGGVSGFGLESARWLASRGAGHLVLVNRRGMETPGAQEIIDSFESSGVTATIIACDITDASELAKVIADIEKNLPPLKGIIHAAAVFNDALIQNLDATSMEVVLKAKLLGAWNLHQMTLKADIKYFILYSSITTFIGNPGQGNYVAANAGLESLSMLRHSMGLPALCVAFGPIGDAGYLIRNEAIKESLSQRLGREPLIALEALDQLDYLLQSPDLRGASYAVANFEWPILSQVLSSAERGRFATLNRGLQEGNSNDSIIDFKTLIAGKTQEEITEIVRTLIRQEVAQILCLDVERIAPTRSLHDLGMDSLMAVELVLALEQRVGIRLPTMMLNESPTVERVTTYIVQKVLGTVDEATSFEDSMVGNLAKQHGEQISEEDIQNLTKDRQRITDEGIRLTP